MAYDKQTWTGSTPITPGRLQHLEDGLGDVEATYAPKTGIPKTSLVTDVQTSLGKADAAIQPEVLNATDPLVEFIQFPVAAFGVEAVNTAAIAQDVVTTAPNGDVYATFWDAARNPRIAKLGRYEKTWTTFDLSTVLGNPLAAPVVVDSHNNIVLAIDGDGYIHVSGNHHDHPIRYMRSANPYDITAWVTPGMVGTDENSVTYPQFVRLTGGDLLFFYRNGASGNGDHYVNRYNKTAKTWSRVAQLFKGTAPVSPDESAYINRVVLDSSGALHIFYLWRTTTDATSCHDISYIKSTDSGVTWKSAAGTSLALPIQPSITSTIVRSGSPAGLVNQPGASVDSAGVPHAFWWLTDGAGMDLHHFYYSGGTWHDDVVAVSANTYVSRVGSFSPGTGETFAIFARAGIPTAKRVAPTLGSEVTLYPYTQSGWEPTHDVHAPDDKLRLMLSPARVGLSGAYAGVLTVGKSVLVSGADSLVVPRPQVAYQPEQPRSIGGVPVTQGYWFGASGVRDTSAVVLGQNEFRGQIITVDNTAVITDFAIQLLGSGSTGAVAHILATDLAGKPFFMSAAMPVDSTVSVAIRYLTGQSLKVSRGQTFVLGILVRGAAGPSFARISGLHDSRIGALGLGANLQTNLTGLSTSGVAGTSYPSSDLVLSATSNVPVVVFKAGF